MGKLNALQVQRAIKPGMYADGDGLYLQVAGARSRSWLYRFTLNGRERYLGLGSASAIDLKRARELAAEARRLRAEGIDPLEQRRAQRTTKRLKDARTIIFKECGEKYIASHEAAWRSDKHRQQWKNTLTTYVYPVVGALPVQDIDTALVIKVIEPIWLTRPETASRVRGRIESILDWAKARGFRAGENPARWRGHLDHLLPNRSKISKVVHHAALPYREIPAFMADLRGRQSISARCLEVTILAALRTSEAIGARLGEIDLEARLWTVPGSRMKTGTEHRIPLSERVLNILRDLRQRYESEYVFPGGRAGKPLSNMAMLKMLALMGRDDLTVHGFRSSFRDWAAECTNFSKEVAEMALAHAVGDKVEAAYRRGDLFEKRRRLMTAWAEFCGKSPAAATVVPLRAPVRQDA
jgi:integrase